MIVYEHLRADTGLVFYIGAGHNKSRAYSKRDRNNYWHDIVNRHGYIVNILFYDLSDNEAYKQEIHYIKRYGRTDNNTGILCNMTNGGLGSKGLTYTPQPAIKPAKSRPATHNKSLIKELQYIKDKLPAWWHTGCGRQ